MKSAIAQKYFGFALAMLVALCGLMGCETVPTTAQSRASVQRQFSGKPIDSLLLAWGPPMSDTRRGDGARVFTYTYSNMYDFGTKDQRFYKCTAVFVLAQPDFHITEISLDGADFECTVLAEGRTGQNGSQPVHPNSFFRDHPPAAPF